MRRCAPSGPRARSPLAMARQRSRDWLGCGQTSRPHAAGNRGQPQRRYRIGGACEPPKPADRPCATMATRQPKQTRKEAPWKIPKAESQRRIFQGKSPTTLAQIALCARSARTPARWPRGRRGSAVRACRRGRTGDGCQLRAHHIAGARSHREEAAGPLSPWKQGSLGRFLRLQPALPVLPERLHRLRRRARRALAREIAPAELVELAASLAPEGNIGLAFTKRAARGP